MKENNSVTVFPCGGVVREAEYFILENQLLRTDLWDRFISVFRLGSDSENGGWRGEYFGKMMRGAVFTYRYLQDEKLYETISDAINGMLLTQREDGTVSSYLPEKDFFG